MPRNYDSSIAGRPYWRVESIHILYDQNQVAQIGYTERLAVVSDTGAVMHVDAPGATRRGTFSVSPSQLPNALPLVINPTTGATGPSTTYGAAMLHILSALRADQLAHDASQEPPAPPPAQPE